VIVTKYQNHDENCNKNIKERGVYLVSLVQTDSLLFFFLVFLDGICFDDLEV
jgi:hypothetical protein